MTKSSKVLIMLDKWVCSWSKCPPAPTPTALFHIMHWQNFYFLFLHFPHDTLWCIFFIFYIFPFSSWYSMVQIFYILYFFHFPRDTQWCRFYFIFSFFIFPHDTQWCRFFILLLLFFPHDTLLVEYHQAKQEKKVEAFSNFGFVKRVGIFG